MIKYIFGAVSGLVLMTFSVFFGFEYVLGPYLDWLFNTGFHTVIQLFLWIVAFYAFVGVQMLLGYGWIKLWRLDE